ncbi:hypothetical protein [Alteromonas sp. ASW11-130]|uniref:hypothetical protein n=1 Tax=Alteromonas sp. ASW11-130 TaxID=3015775 RepID=UPI002241D6BE|nr:hypothetical protein [Alteromonas sp. ASW11-130]MCW8092738.1 hypothetical protein [Alteromonas sp. ASW11-130]
MKNKVALLFIVAMTFFSVSSHSAVIKWYLNAEFNDGSSISGSYQYNADLNTFSNIDVMSSNGSAYTQVNPDSSGNESFLGFIGDIFAVNEPSFTARLVENVTNSGGAIDIMPGYIFSGGSGCSFEGFCYRDGGRDCGMISVYRDITRGYVTSQVNEPSLLAILLLAGIGLALSRKQPATTQIV